MSNPIEIFYCWQAIVQAMMVCALTQLVKVGITARLADKWDIANPKRAWWMKRVIMPAVPPVLGFLGAAAIPIRPEALIEYVATQHIEATMASLVYGAWGAAIGQVADHIRTKVMAAVKDKPSSE